MKNKIKSRKGDIFFILFVGIIIGILLLVTIQAIKSERERRASEYDPYELQPIILSCESLNGSQGFNMFANDGLLPSWGFKGKQDKEWICLIKLYTKEMSSHK